MRKKAACDRGGDSRPARYSNMAVLRLSHADKRRLERALLTARRLNGGIEAGEALRQLCAEARVIEACAEQTAREGGLRLPTENHRPRLAAQLEGLLGSGEVPLTEKALMNALREGRYTQRELWAVPEALRIAIVRGYVRVARCIVRAAEDCAAAERWLARPRRLRGVSPAFLEHALMRCGEAGLTEPRQLLERYMDGAGLSPERVIRQAHDARAHDALRLDNLAHARRLLDWLDWQTCFETLSEVDAALRRDPNGIYPRMDAPSRQAVREQVEQFSRRTGLSELAIARRAVASARECVGDEIRGTVCWWLYDDAGRRAFLEKLGCPRLRLPKIVPDPKGNGTAAVLTVFGIVLALLLALWLDTPWLVPACVAVGWTAASAIVGWVFPLFVKPARLLKLKFEKLPDDWATLIVTPVLLPDVAHAEAACDNLETLGCMEDDPNLCCLLLGDFADAEAEHMPGDDAILSTAQNRVAAMNAEAGREKYFYLHRPRTLLKRDNRWMGRDRKRGAIEDLNRLLTGGASAFLSDGAALRNRFTCVVTLDADTRMLPGTAQRLAGALAHPLNRRYAVLQPRMEVAPSACVNRFAWVYSGAGGLDSYPTSVSSLWMDLTGTGVYGGKGAYHVGRFHAALDGALPEGRVLSHDLIEGALAGAGFLGDIALYDGCPATFDGWLRRQHRWTRGDWQLLPLLFTLKRLSFADRFRMLDNLIRSLLPPAQLALLLWATWTGDADALLAALLSLYLNAVLHPLTPALWARAQSELLTLPRTAGCMLDATFRALWRRFISKKKLLEWVPSADAEQHAERPYCHWLAAMLPLPGLMTTGWPLALAFAALFGLGGSHARELETQPVTDAKPLTDAQRDMLRTLARDTWRFFAEMDADIPPDNLQLDPPAAPVRRTSPTNIGLYLLSCVAARELALIGEAECVCRVSRALDACEHMEKWRGHIYNWVDIDTLKPLSPRYVSAVDSGNLAACALACAGMLKDEALSQRLRGLAAGMDFAALYDEKRQLFRIGVDVENNTPSASRYDLLASESRILSFTAILLGQVPVRHWHRLGRACVPAGGGAALLSWSGTMFEYLMPALLMKAPALSLLGGSARAAVRAQMAAGTPWGISESGCHAFDRRMNYQYRAFGLNALSLGGATGGVVAPYASALALAVEPFAAAENLERMAKLGWRGEMGFYEAADTRRPNPDGTPALVFSHMAHHQGMTLCAVCNVLTGDSLVRGFMRDPRARAVSLLLEERPAVLPRLRKPKKPATVARNITENYQRTAERNELHLLSGREAQAFVTPDGAIHYARNGIDATRFNDDLLHRPDAANVFFRVNHMPISTDWRAGFGAGDAVFEAEWAGLRVGMTVSLSPEDDTLYRAIELRNDGETALHVEALDVLPVALARPEDMRAHAAFQKLFVQSEKLGEDGLLSTRRSRNPGEHCPALVHRAAGYDELSFEADDAVSALRATLTLRPGETRRLCFCMKLVEDGEARTLPLRPERAAHLSRSRASAMLGFLGLTPAQYHRLDRLAARLVDPHLDGEAVPRPCDSVPKSALWALGLSGDRPIIALWFTKPEHIEDVRLTLRAHAFYTVMGLDVDLALVDGCAGGYDAPGRKALLDAMNASPVHGREHVWVLSQLSDEQRDTLRRASAVWLESGPNFSTQNRMPCPPLETPLNVGPSHLAPLSLDGFNGWGGFARDGAYIIEETPTNPTPAPWCNLLAHETMGLLLTTRGGGFLWHGNSRSGRLTEFRGDAPWLKLCLCRTQTGEALALLPRGSNVPFRVRYTPDEIMYTMDCDAVACETAFRLDGDSVLIDVNLENRKLCGSGWTVCAKVDWLMGTDARDAVWLRTWSAEGGCFASGVMPGVGFATCDRADAMAGEGLCVPVLPGVNRLRFAVGWAEDAAAALCRVRGFQEGYQPEIYREKNDVLTVETPDLALNAMMNGWLLHQVRASRLYGRTGFYQPGGAYGFRDQLQDVLALLPTEPEVARKQILLCAGRQFAAGDVLHWWHMPFEGVRTRISDDRLFLPFVTAAYVRATGDGAILDEVIPYLEDVTIPDRQEDIYRAMTPGSECGTLHDHCMRAFRAAGVGEHGLALMGAGDWNDGMNRVGVNGVGESVWLSEFIIVCAEEYAGICTDEADAEWLRTMAQQHREAVEQYGWDGSWYRRAYMDDGTILGGAGSEVCQIDIIAQAWAVLAGLSPERCRAAIDAAWERLVDEKHGLIKLLAPPFTQEGVDPGYIRGYPAGVRENGAQYTHAACWFLLALIEQGDAQRAHAALDMLLPPNHADTMEKARRYRVEPFVTAADVYALPGHEGRGGWTWYTGSAAWLYVAVLKMLGFERRGDSVTLNALLGDWPEVAVTLRYGSSTYRLISNGTADGVTMDGVPVDGAFIALIDDGRSHEAVFPARNIV